MALLLHPPQIRRHFASILLALLPLAHTHMNSRNLYYLCRCASRCSRATSSTLCGATTSLWWTPRRASSRSWKRPTPASSSDRRTSWNWRPRFDIPFHNFMLFFDQQLDFPRSVELLCKDSVIVDIEQSVEPLLNCSSSMSLDRNQHYFHFHFVVMVMQR